MMWFRTVVASGAGLGATAIYFFSKNNVNGSEPLTIEPQREPKTKNQDNIKFISLKNENVVKTLNKSVSLKDAIEKSQIIIQKYKERVGAPGMVVGVRIDGKVVWEEGFGYADVENNVLCTPDTVMRIASISKSITMLAVAKLIQDGLLNIDKPVQEYVPYFPEKHFKGEKVQITTRQLISHLSGIRHYDKELKKDEKNENSSSKTTKSDSEKDKEKKNVPEFEKPEPKIKEHFDSLEKSIDLFKNDPLLYKPGEHYLYSTHAWTLVSAVVESIVKTPFPEYMTKLFQTLGMKHTYLDDNSKIIYNRARYYIRSKNRLVNAQYVDNSYKWAGGGFLSVVGDLTRFGNIMLYSYQCCHPFAEPSSSINLSSSQSKEIIPGFLNSSTVQKLWEPVKATQSKSSPHVYYGMGWVVITPVKDYGHARNVNAAVFHTGGAIGASSILVIEPKSRSNNNLPCVPKPPKGIVVAIITNMQSVNLEEPASEIIENFKQVKNLKHTSV